MNLDPVKPSQNQGNRQILHIPVFVYVFLACFCDINMWREIYTLNNFEVTTLYYKL